MVSQVRLLLIIWLNVAHFTFYPLWEGIWEDSFHPSCKTVALSYPPASLTTYQSNFQQHRRLRCSTMAQLSANGESDRTDSPLSVEGKRLASPFPFSITQPTLAIEESFRSLRLTPDLTSALIQALINISSTSLSPTGSDQHWSALSSSAQNWSVLIRMSTIRMDQNWSASWLLISTEQFWAVLSHVT